MRAIAFAFLSLLAACTGLSWDTRVAETRATRLAMLQSVEIGRTTEGQFTARWGQPTQRIREGGQTELVYRAITDTPLRIPQVGVSDRFVIVTFQYGKAVGARSSDTELCRASFPPRPPGFGFSTPSVVRPIGTCPGAGSFLSGGPQQSQAAAAEGAVADGGQPDAAIADGINGSIGEAVARRPGVREDRYDAQGTLK